MKNVKNPLENLNGSAYRVFETLKFLVKKPASVPEIQHYLESLDNEDIKGYSKAVVYKYLTTLKVVGITLVRKNCKYEVINLPFKINFSENSLNALAILNNASAIIPEKYLSEKISEFFYQLKMRYSLDFKLFEKQATKVGRTLHISKPTIEQSKKLLEYENYCKENFRLQIRYYNLFGEEKSSIIEPLDVKFEDRQVCFTAFCTKTNSFLELNINQILEIKQTPLKCSGKLSASTTVFKLKDKLARRYMLRNDEQVLNVDKDGVVAIANKNEPKDKLYLRLMRYADLCEVVTSKKDKEFMLNLINKTLSNYDES